MYLHIKKATAIKNKKKKKRKKKKFDKPNESIGGISVVN